MQRTGRASMGWQERVHLMSRGTRSRREGSSSMSQRTAMAEEVITASFVNREVARWMEEHGGTDRQVPEQKRGWQKASSTSVSLAGTSMNSPILGSVVFDLTF